MSKNIINIPKIALGTWGINSEELVKLIPQAVKIGYRHFDTARKYSNEDGVGEGIGQSGVPRSEIFITTKLWRTDFLRAKSAFNASLERLQTDYIDLYLLHWPFFFWSKAWRDLEVIYKSGKAKNIGVSNFTIRELEAIKKKYQITPAVNQIEFSPFYYQKDLLEYCRENNIQVEAYSPLTRGFRLEDSKLKVIANKYQKSVPQILIAWVLKHGLVALPKTTSLLHLQQNWDAQSIELTEEDFTYLNSLNENYSALSTFWSRKK